VFILLVLLSLSIFGLVTSTVFAGLALAGARRFVKARRLAAAERHTFTPPVSLFKPLHGAEPDLEAHLESFYLQDYPEFEILFCARQPDDAGLEAARRVAARHGEVPTTILTSGEPIWPNAKTLSLERMAEVARFDLFIISDSDVRVTPDYVRAVVSDFADGRVGASNCLYRGVAEKTGLWSKLEAAGMSVEMTAGVLAANLMEGMQFVLGPTMAVRRECVHEMGGFRALGQYCADDFELGNEVFKQGHKVALSTHVIDHMVLNESLAASVKHQVRWMKSTRFSRPKGHLGTALTFCIPFGLLGGVSAAAMGHPWLGLALLGFSISNRVVLGLVVGGTVVADRRLGRVALLYPLRDLMGFCYWVASYGGDTVVWRGEVYRLTAGGRMVKIAG
jgi:ceramide glucosyltransferase